MQVGDGVALAGKLRGREGNAARRLRPDTRGVVHKIGGHALLLDLFRRQAPAQLAHQRAHHLQMGQLLGADVRQNARQLGVGHGVPLAQIPQAGADLAVRPAILADDDLSGAGVRVFDVNGVLQMLLIAPHGRFSPPLTSRGRA